MRWVLRGFLGDIAVLAFPLSVSDRSILRSLLNLAEDDQVVDCYLLEEEQLIRLCAVFDVIVPLGEFTYYVECESVSS